MNNGIPDNPRAECGCPTNYRGQTVHRIECKVRVGTPVVFASVEQREQARHDIAMAYTQIADLARMGSEDAAIGDLRRCGDYVEAIKQKLHAIALARAVLG